MISKRYCPHTGVVNYFAVTNPFVAVGSVSKIGTQSHYAWRCYLDDPVSGTAPDVAIAETELKRAIANRRHLAPRAF